MTSRMTEEIESPCTGVCQLDAHDICKGCFRSMREIAVWPAADRESRLEILRAAERRRQEKRRQGV
jgi:predicted Fe-S protein YdhL (DUF1289 family)